jgi:plastocyanin
MKREILLFVLLSLSIAPFRCPAAEAMIEGVVALPPPKLSAAYARYAQKAGTVNPPAPQVAIVYLEGTFAGPSGSNAPLIVEQKSYQFNPAIVALKKGTTVVFPNQDDDYHHVFSYSKAKEFDLGRYRNDEKTQPTVVFDKLGLVKIGCEIHDHMRAFVLVLDTPHFVKTETNGAYRLVIKEPIEGKYLLKAWIDEKTLREQAVELKDGAKLQVNFPGK